MTATPMPTTFLSTAEAARRLGLAPATLRSQVRNGKLAAWTMGRALYFERAEIARYERESLRERP